MTISEFTGDVSAFPLFKQSLKWFHQLGDMWGIGRVSQFLGQLFLIQGDYEQARIYFEDHLKIDESSRFNPGTMVALQNLGNLYRHQGDYDQATGFYEKSLLMSREQAATWNVSNSIWYLGLVALHRNDYRQARQHFIDYYKLARDIYVGVIGECDFLTSMAAVAGGMNRSEHAAKLHGASQALFESTNYRIPPFDRAEFDRHIQMAEKQLGGAKFEELMSEGFAMTMEQAVAYALEGQED
jgi:tetratricopeptide (TPR) repeat protein